VSDLTRKPVENGALVLGDLPFTFEERIWVEFDGNVTPELNGFVTTAIFLPGEDVPTFDGELLTIPVSFDDTYVVKGLVPQCQAGCIDHHGRFFQFFDTGEDVVRYAFGSPARIPDGKFLFSLD
jgi:hypothetical protein